MSAIQIGVLPSIVDCPVLVASCIPHPTTSNPQPYRFNKPPQNNNCEHHSNRPHKMSLIEERLRFQELEPTGRLHGIPSAPLAVRPGEQQLYNIRSPRLSPRPIQGEKGYQQWQDYDRQNKRPTYLGNDDPNAQLSCIMTDQAVNRLPYAPRRAQTHNFVPRLPPTNVARQPNPLYCSPHQAAAAAAGKASKTQAPRLNYNTITGDPSSMVPRGMASGAAPDARITRLAALRSQDWSMYAAGGDVSTSGYGKAAIRPVGKGARLSHKFPPSTNCQLSGLLTFFFFLSVFQVVVRKQWD